MSEVLDKIENRGIIIGEKRGREKINTLYATLLKQNRMEDLKQAITDPDYQRQLLIEYGISSEED